MTDAQLDDDHFYNDLDATLDQVWKRLRRGVADRRSAMHTAQLASIGLDGAPRVRTVVLRGADRGARRLRVHTDRRSPKFAEMAAQPRVEVCAYDPRGKVQIRARGAAELAVAAGAEAAWSATGRSGRVCYRSPAGPGMPLDDPAWTDPQSGADAVTDADAGREHFSVVFMTLEHIDWLYLAARGHRRAGFDWHDGRWVGRWLAP